MAEFHALGQNILTGSANGRNQFNPAFFSTEPFRSFFLKCAADFTDNNNCLGFGIIFEHLEVGDKIGTRIGISADCDCRGNAIAVLSTEPHGFIGQTA